MMAVLQDSFSNSTPALFTTTSKPPNRAIVTRNTSAKNKTKQETSVKSGKKPSSMAYSGYSRCFWGSRRNSLHEFQTFSTHENEHEKWSCVVTL